MAKNCEGKLSFAFTGLSVCLVGIMALREFREMNLECRREKEERGRGR
jgi:hypothetical protein